MKIEKNKDGSARIDLSALEMKQFKTALEGAMEQFRLMAPVIKRLVEGMKSFEEKFKGSAAAEACQRLDPAFSGPAIDNSTVRKDAGRNVCVGEGPHEEGLHIEGCPDGE